MTIILFLIDTSASMNQRTYLGARPTLLDVAKDAVEKFLKLRQRDSASRGDRYMLLTFEEPPANIKAGWKEHHNVFMNELKNLTANGLTTLGPAIRQCFDLLNLNRMQTGIDTYGQGRCPYFLEPSIIIVITDGGKLTNNDMVQEFSLPRHSNVPGSELTKEPYRWDQRLFALVLRLTGTPPTDHLANGPSGASVPCDISRIDAICDMTGGRSYSVSSQRSLMQCLESVVQKIQGGVVIQFEKVGADPPPIIPSEEEEQSTNKNGAGNSNSVPNGFIANHSNNSNNSSSNSNGNNSSSVPVKPAWHSCRKLIYVQRSAQKGYSVGYWPIPEAFWPDLNCPSLPPRTSHPIVKFTCNNSDYMVIDNLPFDKYELEPSSLTQYILSRKQPNVAWQCFVANSHKSSGDLGLPFGYLKASTNLSCVNLFVLPYNYPVLLPLLEDLFKVHHCKPTREWKIQFDNYLKNMPLYYASPLKRALSRMGAPPNLVPDSMENCLSYSVLNYLKRLKNQAKVEFDKIVLSVGTGKPMTPSTIKVSNTGKRAADIALSTPEMKTKFSALKTELNDFSSFSIRLRDKSRETKAQCYRNPYDIARHDLIDQIHKMRNNFLQPPGLIKFQDEDQIHSLPISQMGNYQEYLKKMPTPLRELESAPVRQHMFGNPFKIDKKGMMVDEADIDLVGGGQSSPLRSPKRPATMDQIFPPGSKFKRRPGPLPKDFTIQRPYSPTHSPFSSPIHSPQALEDQIPSPFKSPEPSSSISSPEVINQIINEESSVNNHNVEVENNNQVCEESKVSDESEKSILSCASTTTPETSTHLSQKTINSISSPPPVVEPINGRISVTSSAVNHTESFNGPVRNSNGDRNNKRVYLTAEEMAIKRKLFKLVRRPGKNYEPILAELSRFKGSMREFFLHTVIEEASRFKRKSLIDYLTRKMSESKNSASLNGKAVSNAPTK
ncbi:integrator complex subunit 6-like protein [Dinothrombium tinctorium]|uniref:Integrator complex subunit 6-like protein n=1 Tax=Dinothrombium tinctorium TaxID=1965070 RepID=A0A3S3SMW7_9ACAR|nr:integrator complex subunit 6-like protein [Dinothrombium tinctorium]RWS17489.1 integrator complex subunit 6-like protein [Dinothrombium tinctorium]